jgi:hypothetical protein
MRNLCIALALLACGTALAQRAAIAPLRNPPPAPAVTTPPTAQGVPPTPAPAFPGLPTTPTVPSTPSTTGPSRVNAAFSRGAEVNDPTQIAAAQVDLAALALFNGPVDGQLSAPTRASIRQFQLINRLPATGQLDAATAATLSAAVLTNPGTNPAGAGSAATVINSTTGATTTTTTPQAQTVTAPTATTLVPPILTAPRIGPPTSLPPTRAEQIEQFPLSIGSLNPEPIFIQP